MRNSIRPLVFWPTFLATTGALNDAILDHFSWLFSLSSLYPLVLAVVVYVSPPGITSLTGWPSTSGRAWAPSGRPSTRWTRSARPSPAAASTPRCAISAAWVS